jgi:hypothetical protein
MFGFLLNKIEKDLIAISVEDLQNFEYNEKELAEKIKAATDKAYEQKQLTQEQYEAITATR